MFPDFDGCTWLCKWMSLFLGNIHLKYLGVKGNVLSSDSERIHNFHVWGGENVQTWQMLTVGGSD